MMCLKRAFQAWTCACLLMTAKSTLAAFPTPHPTAGHVNHATALSTIRFEPNTGQFDDQLDFIARCRGYSLLLTSTRATFAFNEYNHDPKRQQNANASSPSQAVMQMTLVGAGNSSRAEGAHKLKGVVNYITDGNSKSWHTGIPTYGEAIYRNVYPGIDVTYHGTQGKLEYDFTLKPRANADAIRLRFSGMTSLMLGKNGSLALENGTASVQWKRPAAYQTVDGKRHLVDSAYQVKPGGIVTFSLGKYDHTRPLVIDPVFVYSTYLGQDSIDWPECIAVDESGYAYIAGGPGNYRFPSLAGMRINHTFLGGFVEKLTPDGADVLYTTYLYIDDCHSIGIDGRGDVFVLGTQNPSLFWPYGKALPFDVSELDPGGHGSAVMEIDPTGSKVLYASLLPHSISCSLASNRAGEVYIAGSVVGPAFLGRPVPTGTTTDMFGKHSLESMYLLKLDLSDPTKDPLKAVRIVSANHNIVPVKLALTPQGSVAVTGDTRASNYPTTPNAFQPDFTKLIETSFGPPLTEAFLTVFDAGLENIQYSTYFGGNGGSGGEGLAVDASGIIAVEGRAGHGLTTTPGTYQPTLPGTADNGSSFSAKAGVGNVGDRGHFVAKFDINKQGAASLVSSTYLGTDFWNIYAFTVDAAGNSYVAGSTNDSHFVTTPDALQPVSNARSIGSYPAFLFILSPANDRLLWSTYLGEGGMTEPKGLAVDDTGDVYVTGETGYEYLPTTNAALLAFPPGGAIDGFAIKITGAMSQGPAITSVSPYPLYLGVDHQLTITGTGFTPTTSVTIDGLKLPATVVSPTKIVARMPLPTFSHAATLTISDGNSGLGDTRLIPMVDPMPPIAALEPPTVGVGQAGVVNVYGSGFSPAIEASINGSPFQPCDGSPGSPGFYDDSLMMRIVVPDDLKNKPGNVDVALRNPDAPDRVDRFTLPITSQPAKLFTPSPNYVTGDAPSPMVTVAAMGLGGSTDYVVRVNDIVVQPKAERNNPQLDSIDIVIPADLLASPGLAAITIDNTKDGGGPSAPVLISILPAGVAFPGDAANGARSEYNSTGPTMVTIVNATSTSAYLYKVDVEGDVLFDRTMEAGKQVRMQQMIGSEWIAADKSGMHLGEYRLLNSDRTITIGVDRQ